MNQENFWKKVSPPNENGCMEWSGHRIKSGYGRFHVTGKHFLAHRLAWILTNGEIPSAVGHHGTMVVCHKCDNPSCCNPDHLFLGTQQENVKDRDNKGRCRAKGQVLRGERSGATKLTNEDVISIRNKYAAGGVSTIALGRIFGIHPSCIHRIIKRKTWTHI